MWLYMLDTHTHAHTQTHTLTHKLYSNDLTVRMVQKLICN